MSNKLTVIVTFAVALLAVAAVVFTVIMLDKERQEPGNGGVGVFTPDEELKDEMNAAAGKLVRDNHKVFRLFYIVEYALPVPSEGDRNKHTESTQFENEHYRNITQDGYYTLKPGVIEFDTVDELFELVDKTFVETAADAIKNDSTATGGEGSLYKERVYESGKIGVNANYRPIEYNLVWGENITVSLDYISETECVISVTLADASGGEAVKQMPMVKEDDGVWRLENIFY